MQAAPLQRIAMTSFPDHFSSVAKDYARFRPTYPAELFDWIAGVAPARETAWDCACGSGQATLPLAERFEQVIGTDASAEQIALAPRHSRIEWRVASAEESGLEPASIDAVTVAQALHWFDLQRFWPEVRRVLRPRGVIAIWTYGVLYVDDPALTSALTHLHDDIVGPYWPIERGHVERQYESLEIPFKRIPAPALTLSAEWSLDQLLGYLRTWSGTRRYIAAIGADPIAPFGEQIADLWGEKRTVKWPLSVIAATS